MLARLIRVTPLLLLPLFGCDLISGPSGLDHITIAGPPATALFLVNDTVQLWVSGYTGSNASYPAGPVIWKSSDPTVVAVTTDGQAVGIGVGAAQITATVGDKSDNLTMLVGGTRHSWNITASETWTRAGSPHVVRNDLSVAGTPSHPAIVTIEAGATVQFDSGTALTFGVSGPATLDVQGTADAPVVFQTRPGQRAGAAWFGLTLVSRMQSTLRYVTVSGCGLVRSVWDPPACIVLGDRFGRGSGTILVDHLTIQNGGGAGAASLILFGESSFAQGSTTLSVNNFHGYVAAFPANALARFPTGGTFTANDTNEVRLTRATLRDSMTWPATSVAVVLAEPWLIEGPHQPVLTIPPGFTIPVAPRAALIVGKNGPGGLQVGSDAGAQVTFRAANASGWGGIDFFPAALPSAIHNTLLDHCGTGSDDGGPACLNIVGNAFGLDPAPVLTNVTMRNGTLGAAVSTGGSFGPGSHDLTITGMSSNPLRFVGSTPGSLPAGSYTGNAVSEITLWNLPFVTRSETWRNVGLPYVLFNAGLGVENPSDPILTLEPGVVIRFPGGAILTIGQLVAGRIHAVGTAEQPIVLTDQYGRPGSWGGVTMDPSADSLSVFDHVIVENAINGFALSRDLGSVITNTTVRGSSECGILRLGGTWTTDFRAAALGNTFDSNAGGDQCGP